MGREDQQAELLRIGIGGVVPVRWHVEKAGDPGTLTGWASVYNIVDQQDDMIVPGAFRKFISEWRVSKRVIPLTLDHQNTAEGVIGSLVDIEDTAYGLKTAFRFSSTSKAQDARTKAREGHLNGLSVFGPIFNRSFETVAGKSVRLLKEVGLFFVGLTPIPANDRSLVLAAKQDDLAIKPLERCQADNKPGWRWGAGGKCYTFTAGNEESEKEARHKAMQQAAAMGAFPGTGNKSLSFDEFTDGMRQALSIIHPVAMKAAVDVLLSSYQTEPSTDDDQQQQQEHQEQQAPATDGAQYALEVAGGTGPGTDPPGGEPSDSLAESIVTTLDDASVTSDLDLLERQVKEALGE